MTTYKGRDPEPIVTRALQLYEQGQEIDDASAELGVPARTIYRWLGTTATEAWHEAQKGRALNDYERARKRRETSAQDLERLKQQLDDEGIVDAAERNWRLTHVREVLRAADQDLKHQEWVLERILRKIYGQDSPQVQVNINLGDVGEKIARLEAELGVKVGNVIDVTPAEQSSNEA